MRGWVALPVSDSISGLLFPASPGSGGGGGREAGCNCENVRATKFVTSVVLNAGWPGCRRTAFAATADVTR